MTKHGKRPPVGSEMEISEDTNAIKEIYASHLKLIARFRLGPRSVSVSMFSVSTEAAEQVEDRQALDSLPEKKKIFTLIQGADRAGMFASTNLESAILWNAPMVHMKVFK